jgi:hypothetical protein
MNIRDIRNSEAYQNDNNNCTVVTLSVIANMSYEEAQKACAEHGRKKNKGMSMLQILKCYKNFVNLDRDPLSLYRGKTVARLMSSEKSFMQGKTIVIVTSTHIFAVVNGEIQDWMTEGRRHRIDNVYVVHQKVRKFKNQSGSEYTIEKRQQGGWLLTRTATGKTEVITQAMHDKTLKRLYDGEVIPFRSISYTVAIEQAVLFLLIDHVHIDPFKRVYSVRKPRKVIKLRR